MAKIIAIHSYRGGTGKSNLTANLAATLALQGQRVGVVDTDLQSPGIHVLFGLREDTMSKTINDYLWGRSLIEDAAYDVSSRLNGKGKLFLVPASISADEIARILSEGYDVSLLNDGCRQLVRGLNLDYLLIDTHPGLSKETFLSLAVSNLSLLVLRPDSQDFQGTAVTVDVAKQLRVRKMMLLINKVLSRINIKSLKEQVEEIYQVPVAGIFPLSEDMMQLGSKGVFCLEFPQHPFSQEIKQVTQHILN